MSDAFEERLFRAITTEADRLVTGLQAREPRPGARVGHYEIKERIGAGGMGVVFKAEDTRLGRDVALKFFQAETLGDHAARQRLDREARAASALTHRGICTVYDVALDHDPPFIVLELLNGETLRDRMARGAVPEQDATAIATALATALDLAHQRGLVHCDVKPANVFLTADGDIKLLDFGIARRDGGEGPSLEVEGMAEGTRAFMSPEQARGETLDGRTDIYALGVLLRMMVGTPSPALARVIDRMTDPSRQGRYARMSEVALALASARPRRAGLKSWLWTAAAAAAITIIVGSLALPRWGLATQPPLGERDRLLIAQFENLTGRAEYDDVLRDAIGVNLDQSPYLTVVPDARIATVLGLMRRQPGTPITADVAREICEREDIKAFAIGSVASVDGRYLLHLDVINARTGAFLARRQQVVDRDVLAASDELASSIRRQLGESLQSIERFNVPVAIATTGSLEALRLFRNGTAAASRGTANAQEAASFFLRAIAIDPDFALAYSKLGQAYRSLRELERADEAARRAFERRERTSQRERLEIEANYYGQIGEINKQIEALGVWAGMYPNDPSPPNALTALYKNTGQLELAAEAGERATRMNPSALYRGNLAGAYVRLHQYDRAIEIANTAIKDGADNATIRRIIHTVARITNDPKLASQAEEWMATRARDYSYLSYQANLAGSEGRMKDARRLFNEAIELTQRAGLEDRPEVSLVRLALLEAYGGNPAEAIRIARSVLAAKPNELIAADAASVLGMLGDGGGMQEMRGLAAAHASNTFIVQMWQPLVAGLEQQHRGEAAAAIESWRLLDVADRGDYAWLRPSYHLGYARLAIGDFEEARTRFEKVIEYRGVHFNRSLFGLAHLGLARATAKTGDAAATRKAYEKFFEVWKTADADLPVMIEARKEYARLGTS